MLVGLRVDVDTLRGHSQGVPNLYQLFAKHGIQSSIFFSVGPDNMGRHLYRLLKPQFLIKMLRSSAPSLYGWDILLRGTFWPGPRIARRFPDVIKRCVQDGHELGLHSWDHHQWQMKVDHMGPAQIYSHLERAYNAISEAAGEAPSCSATPGWRTTDQATLEKEKFPFRYNSDCRGNTPFLPVVAGHTLTQPQIPTDVPTYDELIGADGVTDDNYNKRILNHIISRRAPILTIHAEVEGLAKAEMFDKFLELAKANGIQFVPLSRFLPPNLSELPMGRILNAEVEGREGWISAAQVDVHRKLRSAVG